MSLRDKMLGVIADVNAQVAEREELVEMIAIARIGLPVVWRNRQRIVSCARPSWRIAFMPICVPKTMRWTRSKQPQQRS